MARSIADWYADHADGSDGNGDDEFLERQAAWDTARSDRQLSRAGRARKGSSKTGKAPARSQAVLSPKQRLVKADVQAMRRTYPAESFKRLVQRLAAQGIVVTREDVAAVLNQPSRGPYGARVPKPARRSADPADKRSGEGAKTTGQPKGDRRGVSKRQASQEPGPGEPSPRSQRAERRQPVRLPPMPLALDPPAKPRKVKKAGWHRARRVGAITVQRRASLPVPPCNACGVIPSVSGMCRCS